MLEKEKHFFSPQNWRHLLTYPTFRLRSKDRWRSWGGRCVNVWMLTVWWHSCWIKLLQWDKQKGSCCRSTDEWREKMQAGTWRCGRRRVGLPSMDELALRASWISWSNWSSFIKSNSIESRRACSCWIQDKQVFSISALTTRIIKRAGVTSSLVSHD